MTKYDPNVLQEFANKLYRKAAATTFLFGLAGAVVGAFVGYDVRASIGGNVPSGDETLREVIIFLPLFGLLIFALVGIMVGRARTFKLRYQAQKTLCQMEVERNTRVSREEHSLSEAASH